MYTYMYGWEFNITNYESRNEAAKFRCSTHILHFCPATIRLSHYKKISHPIILVKVLPYCGLSYSPLNYVVQSPCQCGNRQWAMRNRPFSQSMKLIGYPPVNELYIYIYCNYIIYIYTPYNSFNYINYTYIYIYTYIL